MAHQVLVMFGRDTSSEVTSMMTQFLSMVPNYIISAAPSTFGLWLACAEKGKSKVKRVIKLGLPLAEVLNALVSTTFEGEEGDDSKFFVSSVLRNLNKTWDEQNVGPRRLSVILYEPFDTADDTDLCGAICNCNTVKVALDFIYFSHSVAADPVSSERLGELALLVAGSENGHLQIVSCNNVVGDLATTRTRWHLWLHPPEPATLRMGAGLSVPVRVVPLLHTVSRPPEVVTACTCHGMLTTHPARCAVTGRKPTEREAYAHRLSGAIMLKAAADVGDDAVSEFRAVSTVAASTFDCCVVLGAPSYLEATTSHAADFLSALATELCARDQCLLLKQKNRFGSFYHMVCSNGYKSPLVLVQVAGREDLLMAPRFTCMEAPSHAASAAVQNALGSLPHPHNYHPLSHETGAVRRFQMAAAASVGASTNSANSNNVAAAPSLTKKAARLIL